MMVEGREVVVIGVGESDEVGIVPGKLPLDHAVEASLDAIADAGIGKSVIDGVYTTQGTSAFTHLAASTLADYLGIKPAYFGWVPYGGVATAAALGEAAMAILCGQCETLLLTSSDTLLASLGRTGAMQKHADNAHPDYEARYAPSIISQYALVMRRHQYEFGTTDEQVAAVSVAERDNASRNPRAQMREPISIRDVLESPSIAEPIRLLHCALISDGGASLVMTTADKAREWGIDNPIFLRGFGHVGTHFAITQAPSITTTATAPAARLAFEMAGLKPSDVDLFYPYDNFAPMVIVEIEDMGFCEKGAGGRFVMENCMGRDAKLPINSHGGLLSHAHPGRPLFSSVEAIRQLRGDAGDRQVARADIAAVHGFSGVFSSAAVAVFAREGGK
jgi:acetyl-CoA acetyltransferase